MVKTDLTLKSFIKSKMSWMGFTYLEPMKQPKEDMSILSKSPGKYSSQFIHLGQMTSQIKDGATLRCVTQFSLVKPS